MRKKRKLQNPEPHPTVPLETPWEEVVDIDRDMVELIRRLLDRDIITQYCCQGYTDMADQTHWGARSDRAYILMERTAESYHLVTDLLENLPIFHQDKVSWTIEFDRDPTTDINRILLRFPHQDIQMLVDYLDDEYPYVNRETADSVKTESMLTRLLTPIRGGMKWGDKF